jgi:DNA-binding winged helix-turn-helix (wHTH) protein/tetratricopeptide (TPR) repeat protein
VGANYGNGEQPGMPAQRYRFADLVLDVGQRRLSRDGKAIALTRRTFGLLQLLVVRSPNLVTHTDLAAGVWGLNRIVTPENLAQHVRMLRRALGEDAASPRYVEAVRGEGYRLLPSVSDGAERDATQADAVRAARRARFGLAGAASAAAAALVIAAATMWLVVPTPPPAPRALASPADELVRVLAHGGEGAAVSAEPVRAPIDDREAYDLYAEALEWMSRPVEGAYERAAALLSRAVRLEGNFAYAHAMQAWLIARSLVHTPYQSANSDRLWPDVERRVFDNAQRALSLDPGLGRAHLPIADVYESTWRWAEARAAYERAAALAPDDPYVLYRYSWFSSFSGNHAAAIELAEREIAVQREFFHGWLDLGAAHVFAGHAEAAVSPLERASALEPGDVHARLLLGLANAMLGNGLAAQTQLRSVERLLGGERLLYFLPELALGYALIGRDGDVTRLVAEIEAMGRRREIGAGTYALAYLAAGDDVNAAQWLERAVDKATRHELDRGYYALVVIKQNPFKRPMLEQPSFRELRAQLGAP